MRGEHGQVFRLELAGRIDQHAFDGGAVVGLPLVGLALGKVAVGNAPVECCDGTSLIEFVGAVGEIDFFGLAQRGVCEGYPRGMLSDRKLGVRARPVAEFVQGSCGLGHGIDLDFGAESGSGHDCVGRDGIVFDGADEIRAPLLDLACLGIDPVEVRLQIAVGAGDVALFDYEEDVAAVVGPMQMAFGGGVVGDAVRRD